MRESAPPSNRAHWLQDINSFLLSAVCHLIALVVLGLLTLAPASNWQGISLVARLGDQQDAIADKEGAPAEESEAELTPVALETLLASAAVETVVVPTEVVVSETSPDMETEAAALDRALAELSGAGRGRFGSGGGAVDGDGSPFGREDGFFGLGNAGQTLVYVVDCSDSMNDNGKWRRASEELVRALEELTYDQRYFVIFFSDGAYPMDADGPVPATYDEVDLTRRWISRIEPDGGTNPLPALLYALAMQPDAVYFLSDGEFDPMVIRELRRQNPPSAGQIPIHTISFVRRETIGLMRTIARQSGGKFRFVR